MRNARMLIHIFRSNNFPDLALDSHFITAATEITPQSSRSPKSPPRSIVLIVLNGDTAAQVARKSLNIHTYTTLLITSRSLIDNRPLAQDHKLYSKLK